jgi:hypothetical protein
VGKNKYQQTIEPGRQSFRNKKQRKTTQKNAKKRAPTQNNAKTLNLQTKQALNQKSNPNHKQQKLTPRQKEICLHF